MERDHALQPEKKGGREDALGETAFCALDSGQPPGLRLRGSQQRGSYHAEEPGQGLHGHQQRLGRPGILEPPQVSREQPGHGVGQKQVGPAEEDQHRGRPGAGRLGQCAAAEPGQGKRIQEQKVFRVHVGRATRQPEPAREKRLSAGEEGPPAGVQLKEEHRGERQRRRGGHLRDSRPWALERARSARDAA